MHACTMYMYNVFMPLATVTNCSTTEPVIHMSSTTRRVSVWSSRHPLMSVRILSNLPQGYHPLLTLELPGFTPTDDLTHRR